MQMPYALADTALHCVVTKLVYQLISCNRRWLTSHSYQLDSLLLGHATEVSITLWGCPRQELPRQRQRLQRRGVVALGSEELVKGVEAGSKVRVCKPVTVYHSPKLGKEFDLEGQEGTVMDVRACPPAVKPTSHGGRRIRTCMTSSWPVMGASLLMKASLPCCGGSRHAWAV